MLDSCLGCCTCQSFIMVAHSACQLDTCVLLDAWGLRLSRAAWSSCVGCTVDLDMQAILINIGATRMPSVSTQSMMLHFTH